jgi:hypothetical protein
MNRRELLKSLPMVAALTPEALNVLNPDGTESLAKVYTLEQGPWYLFVVNPDGCDIQNFSESFNGSKVRGSIVAAQDRDVDNYIRIFKLEE